MSSELVFGAMAHVSNRFLLTNLASKATRKFHGPNTHSGHHERCICAFQSVQPKTSRAIYPSAGSHSAASRKLKDRG
jgi:hypothetical protein